MATSTYMRQRSNVCSMHMSYCVSNPPDIFSGDLFSGDLFSGDIISCDVTDVIMKSAAQPTLQALLNGQCDEIYARNLQECNITLFFVWAIVVVMYLKNIEDT